MSSYSFTSKNILNSASDTSVESKSGNNIFDKNMINSAGTSSLNWKVFETDIISSSGYKYKTINIAITDENLDIKYFEHYLDIIYNVSSLEGFFPLDTRADGYWAVVDEYNVFSFKTNNDLIALKDVDLNQKKDIALQLYYDIIRIIRSRYDSEVCKSKGYLPLNCICEDNIYFAKKENKYIVKILPMINTAKINSKDIYVDLFDAAYLYFKLRYPNGERFNPEDEYLNVIGRFLLPSEFCQIPNEFRNDSLSYIESCSKFESSTAETTFDSVGKVDNNSNSNSNSNNNNDRNHPSFKNILTSFASQAQKISKKLMDFNKSVGEDDDNTLED